MALAANLRSKNIFKKVFDDLFSGLAWGADVFSAKTWPHHTNVLIYMNFLILPLGKSSRESW
jgi:hypothetical protein